MAVGFYGYKNALTMLRKMFKSEEFSSLLQFKNIKLLIVSALTLILVYVILGILTWGNLSSMMFFSCISLSIISIYFFKKSSITINYVTYLIPIPFYMLLSVSFFLENHKSLFVILLIIILFFTSITAKFYLNYKMMYMILFPIIIFLYCFIFFPNAEAYFRNSNSQGGKMKSLPDNVTFFNRNGEKIIFSKDTLYVLDFWFSKCSPCYEKFEDFRSIKNIYKENRKIVFYSVGVPLKGENRNYIYKIADSINLNYQTIYINSMEVAKKNLKITSFPYVIILDNGNVNYEGYPYTDKIILSNGITNQIDKALEN